MTKKKLHILFLNSWYPSRVLPANGDFIQRHAESVATQHRVTAIHVVTDPNIHHNITDDKIINGVRTLITYLKPESFPGNRLINFYTAYKKLIKMAGDYDLIHVNRIYPAGIIALLQKKPFIATEHFTGYLADLSINLSYFERYFAKKITKKAAYICPVSYDLEKNMLKLGFKGNYQVIPNVVDTELFYPQNKSSEVFTLIHISSLNNSHKNISGILRVIRKLQDYISDFRFILVGPNPERYINEIKRLGIHSEKLEMTGELPYDKIPEYLRKSNILILFSHFETFSCVIKEAFACGVRVVSSDVGGIKEFFPSDFGILVPKNDEKAFLKAIIEEKEKNKQIHQKMHQYCIKYFSKTSIANAYTKLYLKALKI
ncbi:MAG: hypothetical protein DSY82_00095 [Flavobacteriia bacterium]|nr:MAG: hypothetical protein DSY82_00095 [Flavobacteriia bacterium]